jgi:hypothetical protein
LLDDGIDVKLESPSQAPFLQHVVRAPRDRGCARFGPRHPP